MNPEPKKSRKGWWIAGGVLAVVIIVGAAGSSGSNSSQPASQTANVVQQVVSPAPQAPAPTQAQSNLSNNNYYTNANGNTVHSPAYSNTVPAGATAQCRDGTYSFSQHREGTCSYHGGVMEWLN